MEANSENQDFVNSAGLEFPPALLLEEAAQSGDAALCAGTVLAHPIILLASASAVNRLHDIATRAEPKVSSAEWSLIAEAVKFCGEAERRLP